MGAPALPLDPFTLYRLWLADLNRYRPPKTAELYASAVNRASADLMAHPKTGHPLEWTRAQMRSYIGELTPANAKLRRQALSDYLGWMIDKGHRAENPLEDVVTPRRARGRRIRRALSHDELTRLVLAIAWCSKPRADWAIARRRIALMVLAQYHTGLRPGELCNMLRTHVRLDVPYPYIDVVGTKTGDDRQVPLSTKAQDIFAELIHDRVGRISNVSERSYYCVVSRAGELIGLPKGRRHPYVLRHTFATTLIELGVEARTVAELMGHSDMRSIGIYTVPSDPRMRGAVEVLP